MIIQCPSCQARYRIDPTKSDKPVITIKCPKCQSGFDVPLVSEAGKGASSQMPARRKILVVDDARFFRDAILDILQVLDAEIMTAADAEQALALIRRDLPDLVMLDLKLPNMDGYQLIQAIRAEPSWKGIKLLAMSSVYRQRDEVHKVLLAGADDFLNKSFTPDKLIEQVRNLLQA